MNNNNNNNNDNVAYKEIVDKQIVSEPPLIAHPIEIETARYIAELSAEMVIMANRAGLDLVAYFLSMAHAEAEDAVERGQSAKRSSRQWLSPLR